MWHLDPRSRLATINMGPKLGGSAPLFGQGPPPFWAGGLGLHPSNTKVHWADAYIRTKWHLDTSSRLATIEMGRKLGSGLRPLFGEGELGLHLTQSRLG